MTADRAAPTPDASELHEMLFDVQRPLRYIGGEWNEIVKDHRSVDVTFALAFPDVYEIGMSHLGFRILYAILNARPDVAAERVFCPWPDMADALRRRGRPLATLETRTPLGRMDVVGFSLQYEMTFSNVLEMLDLSDIPLRSAARSDADPLVVAGGPVVFNVEPLADVFDLVLVGDAEEMLPEVLDRVAALKRAGASRRERIREIARVDGVYAPSLYPVEDRDGLLVPRDAGLAPYPVRRRIVFDLDRFPFPDRIIVPHAEIVHDRVSIEIMRGCPVGCRFCQAGYVYRPTRERDPNQVRDGVIRAIRATGYDSFSLASLNTGEYGAIEPVLFDLMDRFEPEHVSVSLSSLHASTMTANLARQVRRVRKSGFTIAPEAGTQRLRNVINKNLTEDQILEASRLAFEAGWDLIKLYFMIGLPTETDADIDGLVELAHAIHGIGRTRGGRRAEVTLSASSFVPKPVTPFQWIGQERRASLSRKQDRIATRVRRGVRFKHHDVDTTFLEAVFSRGDRRLGPVVERAWRAGARFDGWAEHFRLERWMQAFRDEGVDPERYAHDDWPVDRALPWSVVDSRVNTKWLALELRRALTEGTLGICGPADCHGCAPFAKECVTGTVARTTDRPLDGAIAVLSTPTAAGPGSAAGADQAPPLPGDAGAEPQEPQRVAARYRVVVSKTGRAKFLGHLDLARTLLRALRRARMPLVYSQGFNPKPRVQFGPALAVGVESIGECIDVDCAVRIDPEAIVERVNAVLPAGIRLRAAIEIPRDAVALGEAARVARYRLDIAPGSGGGASDAVAAFRARGPVTVRRERKGTIETIDIAASIRAVEALDDTTIALTLSLGGTGRAARPDEVARAIVGEDLARVAIVREALLAEGPDGRLVPLAPAEDGRVGSGTPV